MTTQSAIQKLGDSVLLRVFARVMTIAAPFLIGLIAYLASSWLDGEFEQVRNANAMTAARVSVVEAARQTNSQAINDLERQVAVMQSAQNSDQAALQRWQADTSTKLDRLLQSNTELTAAVSGLAATMQAIQRESDRSR